MFQHSQGAAEDEVPQVVEGQREREQDERGESDRHEGLQGVRHHHLRGGETSTDRLKKD